MRRTDVKLRDTATGTVVRVTYTWHADTNTLVLDPVSRLLAHHHYRVEVGSRIVDRGGNHLRATHWGFTTRG